MPYDIRGRYYFEVRKQQKPTDISGIQLQERTCVGCGSKFRAATDISRHCSSYCAHLPTGGLQLNRQQKAMLEKYKKESRDFAVLEPEAVSL